MLNANFTYWLTTGDNSYLHGQDKFLLEGKPKVHFLINRRKFAFEGHCWNREVQERKRWLEVTMGRNIAEMTLSGHNSQIYSGY